MASPEEWLDAVDWSVLEHAYGTATDLPDRLRRLLSEAPDTAGAALAELDAFVLHQGAIYSCTASVATFVARILSDSWCDGDPPQEGWLLDTLVRALLRRTPTFEEIEQEATAIVLAPVSHACRSGLLTLAPWAFPPGTARSAAQQRFRHLVDARYPR